MSVRFPRKTWYLAAAALALALALAACRPFGRAKEPVAAPTDTPLPTQTPLPAIATPTPTRVPATPTPTITFTPVPTVEEKPTLTPTPSPTAPAVVEETPVVAPAAYEVVRAPKMGNVIRNGSFEEGFDGEGVALGWTSFSSQGAVYAWADETAPGHVSHGTHAQLMRIMGPAEPDRYVGIYQTVDVVAGETYTMALHGIIRSSTAQRPKTPYGHRIQWAIDDAGQPDWHAIRWENWTDPGWNDIALDEKEPLMNVYVQQITPTTDELTLFIRGWTKWPIIDSEAKYYVDGVFLEGPVPGEETVVQVAAGEGGGEQMPTTGGRAIWIPIAGVILVLGLALWEVRKSRVR